MVTTIGNSSQSVFTWFFIVFFFKSEVGVEFLTSCVDVNLCFRLKMYVQAPFDHVKVFMKAEGRKANSVR